MAQCACDLAGLVKLHKLLLQAQSRLEREHGALSACHDDRVEPREINVSHLAGVLDRRRQLWCRDEPHADQVFRRVAARITRIAQGIRLALPTLWAEYLNGIPSFAEAQIWVRELTPPEA